MRRVLEVAGFALRRAHAEGAALHAAVSYDFDAFARGAVRLVARRSSGPVTAESIDAVVLRSGLAGDVFLALACDDGNDAAWHRLAECHLPRLVVLARSRGLAPADAEDLARDVAADLCAAPPDRSARTLIGTYRAAGSIGGWLSVILLRRIVDRARSRPAPRSLSAAADDGSVAAEVASLAADTADPADAAIDVETMARVGGAFHEAWARLPPREGLALRLRYRDDLPLKAIAGILRVGEPRTSRIIQQGIDRLREALGRSLPSEAGGRPGRDDSIWKILKAATSASLANPATETDSPRKGPRKTNHARTH